MTETLVTNCGEMPDESEGDRAHQLDDENEERKMTKSLSDGREELRNTIMGCNRWILDEVEKQDKKFIKDVDELIKEVEDSDGLDKVELLYKLRSKIKELAGGKLV